MVGINVAVPAPMAMFPFTGWDFPFAATFTSGSAKQSSFTPQQKSSRHVGLATAAGCLEEMSRAITARHSQPLTVVAILALHRSFL